MHKLLPVLEMLQFEIGHTQNKMHVIFLYLIALGFNNQKTYTCLYEPIFKSWIRVWHCPLGSKLYGCKIIYLTLIIILYMCTLL